MKKGARIRAGTRRSADDFPGDAVGTSPVPAAEPSIPLGASVADPIVADVPDTFDQDQELVTLGSVDPVDTVDTPIVRAPTLDPSPIGGGLRKLPPATPEAPNMIEELQRGAAAAEPDAEIPAAAGSARRQILLTPASILTRSIPDGGAVDPARAVGATGHAAREIDPEYGAEISGLFGAVSWRRVLLVVLVIGAIGAAIYLFITRRRSSSDA